MENNVMKRGINTKHDERICYMEKRKEAKAEIEEEKEYTRVLKVRDKEIRPEDPDSKTKRRI